MPSTNPYTFYVVVPEEGWNPEKHRGSWILFSPFEELHSIFEVIWRSVQAARVVSEAEAAKVES